MATLKVSSSVMQLSLGFISQLYFNADDIILIEYASSIGGDGIRIIHNVPSYPKKVLFTTNIPYNDIVQNIKSTGFFDKTNHDQTLWYQVKKMQQQGRIAFKTIALIVFLSGWNIPLFLGIAKDGIGASSRYAPISMLFISTVIALTLFSEPFRNLVMKEGREIDGMRKSLYFMLFAAVFGGIIFTIFSRIIFHK